MRFSSFIMLVVAATTVSAACISPLITSKSASTCSDCHGAMFFQFLDILEGDAGEQIPQSIDGNDVLNVTVVIANVCNSGAEGGEELIDEVSATLSSQNRRFRVVDPTCYIGELGPGNVTASWHIFAARAGQDTLVINAQGMNRHSGALYTDEYSPSPAIQVNYTLPNKAPSMTLGGKAGAVLGGGSTLRVCWTSEDEEKEYCRVSLSYSTDGFVSSDIPVASQLPNTGIYDWVLPAIDSPSVRLRASINDSDGAVQSSLGPIFSVDSSPPALTYSTPAGGDANVSAAAPLTIGFSEPVGRDIAENLFTMEPPVQDIGWKWSLDGKLMTTSHFPFEPGTTYNCSMGPGLADMAVPANHNISSFCWSFTVPVPSHPAPAIALFSPLGGERYYRHDPIAVGWNATGGTAPLRVNISFSDDGGVRFRTVASGIAGNAYGFPAPDAKSDGCVVKLTVYDANGLEASASSPMPFSISPPPTLTAAFGVSPVHYVNDTVNMSWNASGGRMNTSVSVRFQSAGGAVVIASGQPPSGSLSWKVPRMNDTAGLLAVNFTDGWGTVTERVSRSFTLMASPGLLPGQNSPPVVSFAVEQMRILARGPATFNANESCDPDGDALNFTWDFGDGTDPVTTSQRSIVHVYLHDGEFRVVLNVTDGNSAVTRSLTITVEKALLPVDSKGTEWLPTALMVMVVVVVMVGAVYIAMVARTSRPEGTDPPGGPDDGIDQESK